MPKKQQSYTLAELAELDGMPPEIIYPDNTALCDLCNETHYSNKHLPRAMWCSYYAATKSPKTPSRR
jgi:hypothetical protein